MILLLVQHGGLTTYSPGGVLTHE
eukprot:COSAG01_NODE_29233_length_642_cov_0.972376_2_plen_23_part_01